MTARETAAPKVQRWSEETSSRAARRLRLLAQVAALVDTPLDLQLTLQQVADLAIGELADWCVVDLDLPAADDETPGPHDPARAPTLVAVAHREPAMVALAMKLQKRYPPAADDPVRRELLDTLQPLLFPEIDDEMLAAGAQDEEHLVIMRSLGMTSAAAVPLQTAGRGFGVMLLVTTGGRRLDADDLELAVELGRRAGAAVDKARLYQRLARTAAELSLSEERYRTLVESGSMALWRAAPDGATITEMPAWLAVTGGSGTTGWGWMDDVHPADRDHVRHAWLASVRSGRPYEQTYRIRDARGGWRWVTARGAPLRENREDPNSLVVEWIGTVTDVTAQVASSARSQALRDCAEALARALDVDAVVTSLHHVAGGAFGAQSVVVALLDGARLSIHQSGYAWLPDVSHDVGTWPLLQRVLESGEPLFLGGPREFVEASEPRQSHAGADGDQVNRTLESGEVAWAVLPLKYGGDVVGAVRFGWSETQNFDPPYQWTLMAVSAQHAAALTRARMYDLERRTSLTLQAALAPDVPREVNGIEIGVHYRPAGIGAQVGGDWADAFALPDGRVALVVGDVMGSGVEAAATMGRMRTALSTLALHESDPASMLADLDRLLLRTPGDLLATLAMAVLDQRTRQLAVYSAGHLPVLLCADEPPTRYVDARLVPPLGVGWSLRADTAEPMRVDLSAGAVVALYTDGLLETRDDPIDERLDLWCRIVDAGRPAGPLDEAARKLVEEVAPAPDDDVTLLLARVPPVAGGAVRPPRR